MVWGCKFKQKDWKPEVDYWICLCTRLYQDLGKVFKAVIQDHLKGSENCIFQQDSAPCHTEKSVSTIQLIHE